jgi:hypothetical protein
MSFPAFSEWVKEMGCHACASKGAEAAEARAEAAEKKMVKAKDACANLGAELAMAVNALPERRVAGLMAAFRELEGTL